MTWCGRWARTPASPSPRSPGSAPTSTPRSAPSAIDRWPSRPPRTCSSTMLTLPPVAPATGWRSSTRLARDHYVRLDSNDYSVHPAVIGRRIEVTAELHHVGVLCDGRVVADHERVWAWHQTISDPEHVAAARALRRERVGVLRPVTEPQVEQRCLADYDTALGLDGPVA